MRKKRKPVAQRRKTDMEKRNCSRIVKNYEGMIPYTFQLGKDQVNLGFGGSMKRNRTGDC